MSGGKRRVMVCCLPALLTLAVCKGDVGPKQKEASDRIRSKEGKLWKRAHVLAVRRVESGRYGGRGGLGSYKRGYMRYHLVLDGSNGPRRVFLYEALYRQEAGEGKGVDELVLKASPDDRCVAYAKVGAQRWRFVRFVGKGVPVHFARPEVAAKQDDGDPCASAPTLGAHFQALLEPKGRMSREDMESALGFLVALPQATEHHVAWARFMTTPGRQQWFHVGLDALWLPVQRIACATPSVRRVYLDVLGSRGAQGTHHHTNAVRALERCAEAEVQDLLATLLGNRESAVEDPHNRLVTARAFARITEARKAASAKATTRVVAALPGAQPRVKVYLARALGTIGSESAHAALGDFVAKASVPAPGGGASAPRVPSSPSGTPGQPAQPARPAQPAQPAGHLAWQDFDQFDELVGKTPEQEQSRLAVGIARAALARGVRKP